MNIVLFLSHIFTAVYGGLDIHGKQRSPVQSFLTATADAGASEITIGHDVDWQVCLSLSPYELSIGHVKESPKTEHHRVPRHTQLLLEFPPADSFPSLGYLFTCNLFL